MAQSATDLNQVIGNRQMHDGAVSEYVGERMEGRSDGNALSLPGGRDIARISSVDNRSHHMVIDSESDDDEIVENTENFPKKVRRLEPQKKRKKLMGNAKYRGGDKIYPSNFCFVFVTGLMIFVPSMIVATVTNWSLVGWVACWFLGAFYLVSMINALRILILCSTTEPGIIPKIRSKEINYNLLYRVKYKEPDQLMLEYKQDTQSSMA